jgi:biopolymer transport protein ExbD
MRRRYSQSGGHRFSELNITPMLDLCFVLLVIFMIAAPFISESSELILPTTKPTGQVIDPAKVYTLSLDKSGNMTLNDAPMTPEQVVAEIRKMKETNPDLSLLLRTHKDQPMHRFTELMDFAREAGVTKVGIVTKTDVN